MVKRVKAATRNVFLTTDGVATRLAIRELKKARIDPGPLLAKAGISLGEKPKRLGAESQIRFLEIAADRSVTRHWASPRSELRSLRMRNALLCPGPLLQI
jgi:hypothetical protein